MSLIIFVISDLNCDGDPRLQIRTLCERPEDIRVFRHLQTDGQTIAAPSARALLEDQQKDEQ